MRLGQAVAPRDQAVERPRLPDDTEIRATDAPVREELAHHLLGGVDRDREADALGHRDDRRVDADDAGPRVDQRPARVARVQRDVSLDDVLDQPSRGASERPTDGADDARRYSGLKA